MNDTNISDELHSTQSSSGCQLTDFVQTQQNVSYTERSDFIETHNPQPLRLQATQSIDQCQLTDTMQNQHNVSHRAPPPKFLGTCQIDTNTGGDYEIPATVSKKTGMELWSPHHDYFTLDETGVIKNGPDNLQMTPSSQVHEYSSLHPSNMDRPHLYVSCTPFINEASSPANPVSVPSDVQPSLENPIYLKSNKEWNTKKIINQHNFKLDIQRNRGALQHTSVTHSDVPGLSPASPVNLEDHSQQTHSHAQETNPDPNYFELEQFSVGYKPNSSHSFATQAEIKATRVNPDLKAEPTYFEIESLEKSSSSNCQVSSAMYSQLENTGIQEQERDVAKQATTGQLQSIAD